MPELTQEHIDKMKAAAKEKKHEWFSAECGRVKIQQYEMGWRINLISKNTMYFADFESAINNRKVADFERFNATDEERQFLANLREGGRDG